MKLSTLVTLTLLSPVLLTADIVTQAMCSLTDGSVAGSVSQMAPAACSVNLPGTTPFGGNGSSFASTSGSITSAGFDVNGTVASFPAIGQSGGADVTASGSLSLITTGPLRSGFVIITGGLSGSQGFDPLTGTLGVTLGALNGNCTFFLGLIPPGAPCGCLVPLAAGSLKLPFQLGQSFLFSENFHLTAASDQSTSNIESGMATIGMRFQLFEVDGVTPVAVSATPEPAEVSLFCAGLIVLGLMRKSSSTKR